MKYDIFNLLTILYFINCYDFFPESYKIDDLIFGDSNDYNKYLIAAKYFTLNTIKEYILNQGISLNRETSCDFQTQKNYPSYLSINGLNTDYKEIYSNIVYDDSKNTIECDFPVQKILNSKYTLIHNLYLINHYSNSGYISISIGDSPLTEICKFQINRNSAELLKITIKPINNDPTLSNFDSLDQEEYLISCINPITTPTPKILNSIKKIKYSFDSYSKSPGVAFYWTIMEIEPKPINYRYNGYYTITGKSICDYLTNPCVEGFACKGGECVKCDPSCFDCYDSDSNTNCGNKCNRHAFNFYSDNGKCNIGYVDLSMFQSINIFNIPPPRNNRMTISFWFYVNNYNNLEKEPEIISHLLKVKFLNINSKIVIECLEKSDEFLVENKWIYFKCGISKDHKEGKKINFIRIFSYNDVDISNINNIDYDVLYKDSYISGEEEEIENDNHYKYYYHEGESISLKFENFDSFNYNEGYFYIKNLILFKEYLPDPYDIKYFELEKIVTSNSILPELLFIIPFNYIEKNGNSYIIETYSYDSGLLKSSITIFPTNSRMFSLIPPKNFKRLPLLDKKNIKFSSSDFLYTENLTKKSHSILQNDDNSIITCDDNFYLDYSNPSNVNCNSNCPNTFSMVFGLETNKGFCNFDCTENSKAKCLDNNDELQNMKSQFECINSDYFDMFYTCEKKSDEKVFYYNTYFNPANIKLDFSNYKLNSYIIEFWMYIDTTEFKPKNELDYNYLFYTNHIMLTYSNYDLNQFQLKIITSSTVNQPTINDIVNIFEWNHLILNVIYDPKEDYNKKTNVYISANNKFNDILISSTENKMTLEKIYFCNGDPSNCDGNNIYWSSAFYKNLRVYNGNSVQPSFIIRYYDLYKDSRLSSIIAYYPLYGTYIQNNKFTEYNDYGSGLILREGFNSWNFPQYNYAKNFDYIKITNKFGYLISENKILKECSILNCKRCHFDNSCYECNNGYILLNNLCLLITDLKDKVLKLPHNTQFNINLLDSTYKSSITITFWIKFYGFTSNNANTIIYYSDNLKLTFDPIENSNYYGLNLVQIDGNAEIVLGNFYHFRKYIGKWAFISVSYYNKEKEDFFPWMLRFELFNKDTELINQISSDLKLNKIHFDDNLYALFKDLKIYNTFLIGAYSFQYHDQAQYNYNDWPNLVKVYFTKSNTCLLSDNSINPSIGFSNQYNCDFDNYDYTELNSDNSLGITNNNFINGINEEKKITNCDQNNIKICYKKGKDGLACNFKNNQEELFIGTWKYFYCKKYDYVNFAKINDIIINDISTASLTKKFTMHFWVYAYNYVDNVFNGFSIEWLGHNIISVEKTTLNEYKFKCSIPTKSEYLDFEMKKWNFLHCAIDYNENNFYINTYEKNSKTKFSYTSIPSGLLNTRTSLIIKDLTNVDDWGILFFQYIRLWSDAFPSSAFLSKIEIINKKFDNLLHQWNTAFNNYNSQKKIIDLNILDNPKDFEVDYKVNDIIGSNYIDESYSILTFCTEKGEYYDRQSGKCIKFIDFSKIQNHYFEINNIHSSYSHNYGISFWILFEKYETLLKGVHISWNKHMKISMQYNSLLYTYCFPQYHYPYESIINDNSDSISVKYSKVLNKAMNSNININGKWLFIQCSLSTYNRKFHLNDVLNDLISETLYEDNDQKIKNDEPLSYFISGNSKLKVEILDDTNQIFIRALYLFRDYIPPNFNYKYIDLTKINSLPSLSLAINFDNYQLNANIFSVQIQQFNLKNEITSNLIQIPSTNVNDIKLPSNFIFLPLCDPTKKEKYNINTNLCEEIIYCNENALNAKFCNDEFTPLICSNSFLTINDDGTTFCSNNCDFNTRSPGTHNSMGLCNTDCLSNEIIKTCPHLSSELQNFKISFLCNDNYNRINYQCIKKDNSYSNDGALFYSRCNNPFNINYGFSDDLKNQLNIGYIIEFWIMFDNIYCTEEINNHVYHYFLIYPHQIIKLNKVYYYRIKNSVNDIPLNNLHQYEWNKIIIKVDIDNDKVIIIENFGNEISKIINEPLLLSYISFCSNKGGEGYKSRCNFQSGNSIGIEWGSAYYSNIHIWNFKTASIDLIQAFNTKMLTQTPKSLIINYPLSIKYMDNNIFINSINPNFENIDFSLTNSNEIYNKDHIILHNYSTKFDWGNANMGKVIKSITNYQIISESCDSNCKRCYEKENNNKCYECKEGYVLKGQSCIYSNKNYYLSIPSPSNKTIMFNIVNPNSDVTSLKGLTITFWLKFYDVVNGVQVDYPNLISLNSITFLAFDIKNYYLVMRESNINAFEYKEFRNDLGKWIPISIGIYISGNEGNNIYPNIFTFNVNQKEIPLNENEYSIPSSGILVTELNIGNECIALFNDLRIYKKLYEGGFGKIMGIETTRQLDLFLNFPLHSMDSSSCVTNDQLSHNLLITCVPDYTEYFDENYYCNNDNKFFNYDYTLSNCIDCNSECNELCYGDNNEKCTCDITKGVYWLRQNSNKETFCEKIPYLDFSNIEPIKYSNALVTQTHEYTIEFWCFIYSYVYNNNFKGIHLEWNFHNKITLFFDGDLKVTCYPIFDNTEGLNEFLVDQSTKQIYFDKWNYIRCGTNLLENEYFLIDDKYILKTLNVYYPNHENIINDNTKDKYFKIYRNTNSLTNFGFIFLREIKLWQQYNYYNIISKDIYFNKDEILSKFPGLLMYFKNLYKDIGSKLIFKEEKTETEIELSYMSDFIGYNIVKKKSTISTDTFELDNFKLCSLGEYYNSLSCISKLPTKVSECEKISTLSENCIICKESNKYLDYINPNEYCVTSCGDFKYENDNINQCRKCHETCFKCTSFLYNSCTQCNGIYYFNFLENTCILNCEEYGLVKSKVQPNTCTFFDIEVNLIEPNNLNSIDLTTFNHLKANLIFETDSTVSTKWYFNYEETNELNSELGYDDMYYIYDNPFISDDSQLEVFVNPDFFKLGHKYVFELEVKAESNEKFVSERKKWILVMNSPPIGGSLKVIPEIGYLNSTTFIIICKDFTDENSVTPIEYSLYYIEENSNYEIPLTNGFSNLNEIYRNFTPRYYTDEYSLIDIYCKAKDSLNGETILKQSIKIINKIDSSEYDLEKVLSNYQLEETFTDEQYFIRSEFLKSCGSNINKNLMINQEYTYYENEFDFLSVIINDPYCNDNLCNGFGKCNLIDVSINCFCDKGYLGVFCQIQNIGYLKLEKCYKELFIVVFDIMNNRKSNLGINYINNYLFNTVYNLFFAAQNFMQDNSFFNDYLIDFINFLIEEKNYILQNQNYIDKLFDFTDFYFNYYYNKENIMKLENKYSLNENINLRNITLSFDEQKIFKIAFNNFIEIINKNTIFLIQNYQKDYEFSTKHFNYHLIKINENFIEYSYYEKHNFEKNYLPYINFMDCLKDKYSKFDYYLNLIIYKQNLFSYETIFYPNITSGIISIKIYDLNGEEISLNCNEKPLKILLSFNSYNWIEEFNEIRHLFSNNLFTSIKDPLFSDPVYVNLTGEISYDSVEERIKKYYRIYNFTGLIYSNPSHLEIFSKDDIEYDSFNMENNYIIFNSKKTGIFTSMIILNFPEYNISGRFFYLKKYYLFKWKNNYSNNPALIICIFNFIFFIFTSIFFFFYDSNYFEQIKELNFLKIEIIKIHNPYNQINAGLNDENIIKYFSQLKKNDEKVKDIKHMFDDFDFSISYNKEIKNEDEKSSKSKQTNLSKHVKFKNENNSFDGSSSMRMNKKVQNKNDIVIYKKKNNYFNNEDIENHEYISIKKFHDINNKLGKIPNEKDFNYQKSLELYTNLNISKNDFIFWNIKRRHIFLSSFINLSLFNKRWKKLFILLTQININMILISILLTYDRNILSKNFLKCLLCSLFTSIISNLLIYPINIMFYTSLKDRTELFKSVINGSQLYILKLFNSIQKKNFIYTCFGIILCFPLWIISFYISFGFLKIWIEQKNTWIIIFIISELLDLCVFELIIELIIGYLYSKRRDNEKLKIFGEKLNRLRNYRTLFP